MQFSSLYRGLPVEFSPPLKAAERLAQISTLTERRAYFDRIPAVWQTFIADQARLLIAGAICELKTKELRRDALQETPPEWRGEIEQHVLRLWRRPSPQQHTVAA